MEALEAAKIAQAALDDKLGQDIQVLNLKGLSNVADCFVIASGKNVNHLRAMADEVEQKLFRRLQHRYMDLVRLRQPADSPV